MGRLEGYRAVITGAASGIGEATTRLFVNEGPPSSWPTSTTTGASGSRTSVPLAVDAFGGLDCMFNNAGNPGSVGGIEDVDMAMFDRTVAIHLRGVFLGIRAATRVMRPQGRGSIINTSSVAGLAANYRGA